MTGCRAGLEQEQKWQLDAAINLSAKQANILLLLKLSRRGLIATTFTGNVPHYDIIASNEDGKHVSVQVKASRASSWQFGDITQFCEISFKGKHQIVGRLKRSPVQRLVVVFVMIDPRGADRYYILTWRMIRDLIVKGHKSYLAKHNGLRAQTWDSLHSAISEKTLKPEQRQVGYRRANVEMSRKAPTPLSAPRKPRARRLWALALVGVGACGRWRLWLSSRLFPFTGSCFRVMSACPV